MHKCIFEEVDGELICFECDKVKPTRATDGATESKNMNIQERIDHLFASRASLQQRQAALPSDATAKLAEYYEQRLATLDCAIDELDRAYPGSIDQHAGKS